jgi:hypothetical protein
VFTHFKRSCLYFRSKITSGAANAPRNCGQRREGVVTITITVWGREILRGFRTTLLGWKARNGGVETDQCRVIDFVSLSPRGALVYRNYISGFLYFIVGLWSVVFEVVHEPLRSCQVMYKSVMFFFSLLFLLSFFVSFFWSVVGPCFVWLYVEDDN